MSRIIRAIVIDDHPLVARATALIVEKVEGVRVAGIAYRAREGLELIEKIKPELVVLDRHLPDQSGSDVALHLRERYPDMYIVLITGADAAALSVDLFRNQLNAIVSKGASEEAIAKMIECVIEDQVVIPRSALEFYARKQQEAEPATLTEYETGMMSLILQGATQEQIAERLFMSKRSVDNHLRKIYDKLGAVNRFQAIEKFIRLDYERQGPPST